MQRCFKSRERRGGTGRLCGWLWRRGRRGHGRRGSRWFRALSRIVGKGIAAQQARTRTTLFVGHAHGIDIGTIREFIPYGSILPFVSGIVKARISKQAHVTGPRNDVSVAMRTSCQERGGFGRIIGQPFTGFINEFMHEFPITITFNVQVKT